MFSQRFSALALAALALVSPAHAQTGPVIRPGSSYRPQIIPFPVNPNMYVAPNVTARQAAYNIAVLGSAAQQVPPYLYGYNPYPSPIIAGGGLTPAIVPTISLGNPYALSTVPTGNPYSPTGSLGTSGYSLSTVPGGAGGYGGYQPYYNPYGYMQDPYSATIQGLASLTAATGQYYINIQQARLTREQSRQMSFETTRKRLELERWYEETRLTAPQMAMREKATDLERARKYASTNDITSGKALNVLLANLPLTGLNKGDNIALESATLKNLNLNGGSSAGNIGMLKSLPDDGKLSWPEALQDKGYDTERRRLERDLQNVVRAIKDGDVPRKDGDDTKASLLRSIRKDYKAVATRLDESVNDLDAGQYIAANRFLNQLKSAIDALSDPKAKNYFNNTWTAKGNNVSELVSNMKTSGLTFAPAAPGEEASYTAMYLALRQFESSLNTPTTAQK